MPRTIEQIMDNHTAAEARRAAGKPIWDITIRGFKTVLHDDTLSMEQKGVSIASMIRRSSWHVADMNSDDYSEDLDMALEMIEHPDDVDDFDEGLDWIYDMADTDRVWLG